MIRALLVGFGIALRSVPEPTGDSPEGRFMPPRFLESSPFWTMTVGAVVPTHSCPPAICCPHGRNGEVWRLHEGAG